MMALLVFDLLLFMSFVMARNFVVRVIRVFNVANVFCTFGYFGMNDDLSVMMLGSLQMNIDFTNSNNQYINLNKV
jgi:hypothetical protein